MEWIIDGKTYSVAEYEVYKKEKEEQEEQAREKARRLIHELGEAYQACSEAMAQLPKRPFEVRDEHAEEHKLYEKLRQNLERADGAPRCEKVREDGTVCGCPQMRGYRYCYAHERMLQTQSQKLELPAQEDANGIQMAIMRVQKALIDDEISEKKAGLLLYSLQMASSNLKHTTFTDSKKEVVTEMRVSPGAPSSKKQVLPLISTDDTDRKSSNWQMADGKSEKLPQMNADKRRSKKAAVSAQQSALSKSKDHTQPGAPPPQQAKTGPVGDPGAVPHEHRLG